MRLIGFMQIVGLAGWSMAAGGCGGTGKTTSGQAAADLAVTTLPTVGMLCTDARADNWQLPLTKPTASGALKVTLLSSQAGVPVIGDSKTTWTLAVADATTGAPLTGAALGVLPWMPDHGHGTSVKAVVTESASTPGQYALEPLYFFMAGYWTVTITVHDAGVAAADGGAADSVVFSLCLTDAT
jgi:YtkA-like